MMQRRTSLGSILYPRIPAVATSYVAPAPRRTRDHERSRTGFQTQVAYAAATHTSARRAVPLQICSTGQFHRVVIFNYIKINSFKLIKSNIGGIC